MADFRTSYPFHLPQLVKVSLWAEPPHIRHHGKYSSITGIQNSLSERFLKINTSGNAA